MCRRVFNKTIFLLGLAGYEMIITNSTRLVGCLSFHIQGALEAKLLFIRFDERPILPTQTFEFSRGSLAFISWFGTKCCRILWFNVDIPYSSLELNFACNHRIRMLG